MWIKHLALLLCGIASGAAVSGGTFAFIVTLKIVPRLVGRSNTAKSYVCYENAVILGGTIGNILGVFEMIPLPFGRIMLWLYGLGAGIFEGCVAITLAEILHVFPIVFRRMKLKVGLSAVIFAFAAGKAAGALYYFYQQLAST
ncbi:MAG: stage V sporulation protein AB [Lachnospiraceae bacterium]